MNRPPRQRTYTRRSRTGCQTCKTRRIKCDETLGSCKNCSSTGRTCDGYETARLPIVAKKGQFYTPSIHIIDINFPGMSSDERRCINFFQTRTMPMLVSFFEWEVWRRLALQLSQAEPAVGHALVSLSAMHASSETNGMSRSRAFNHRTQHHRFAIEQYGRALSTLRRRLTSQDPHVSVIALVCCVVFTYLEVLQGNNENACAHLTNGLQILSGGERGDAARAIVHDKLQDYHHADRSPAMTPQMALLAAIAHLDIQIQVHRYVSRQRDANRVRGDHQQPLRFRTLDEAWRELDPISDNALSYLTLVQRALQDPTPDIFPILIAQRKLAFQLEEHIAAFTELATTRLPCPTPKQTRCMNLIQMQHRIIRTHTYRALRLSEDVWAEFAADLTEALGFGAATIASLEAEFGPRNLPTLVMDMVVILPLTWIALKCRDLPTRRCAVQLLRRWPHFEGPHHTSTFVALVEGAVELEEARRDPRTGVIPPEALVADVSVVRKEGAPPVLGYTLAHLGGPHLEVPFPVGAEGGV
ncbi:hypothetical protein BO86DRAFT_452545 [Aspergillus japonicus CBS 114.51]|uniref:Zn(2)-C6 fungal-type domain-containing protein n=2 Tax=Aspergillus TaxID=5052 RepID=A0A2V5HA77_ASPV1|nr:hypothetical protein BO86DRAFT_452545 [Aspergillus japonicus CBS 114.51]PYI18664.1 hypothetical protein BO99DRAFT_163325 [Aspergillus violaceofuscus CBS 115571]RAH86856.1 hypothetical protein BO86DRAFT_452545 [Aspergillus japonicus CBS 114.51]